MQTIITPSFTAKWTETGSLKFAPVNYATTKAYMGTKIDLFTLLGYTDSGLLPDKIRVEMGLETGTAPAAGLLAYLYWAESADGTTWPAGVTGTAGSYKDGEEAEWLAQLGTPVLTLVATNDGNALQRASGLFRPTARWGAPVMYQALGVNLRNNAASHLSYVSIQGMSELR